MSGQRERISHVLSPELHLSSHPGVDFPLADLQSAHHRQISPRLVAKNHWTVALARRRRAVRLVSWSQRGRNPPPSPDGSGFPEEAPRLGLCDFDHDGHGIRGSLQAISGLARLLLAFRFFLVGAPGLAASETEYGGLGRRRAMAELPGRRQGAGRAGGGHQWPAQPAQL